MWWKAYLQQFPLHLVPHIQLSENNKFCKKKLQSIPKEGEEAPQSEGAAQASEPDKAGMLEVSGWEFQTTMIHVLRVLKGKVDTM